MTTTDRQHQIKIESGDFQLPEQLLKTIDRTVINHFKDTIKLHVTEHNNDIIVPVLYATPERWSMIKNDRVLRDKNKHIIYPLCAVKRTNIELPVDRNLIPNFGTKISIIRDYSNKDRRPRKPSLTPVKRIVQVDPPVTARLSYTITLWAKYNNSINNLIEQIIANYPKGDIVNENTFALRWEIDSFSDESNVDEFSDEVRLLTQSFDMTLTGYIYLRDRNKKVNVEQIFSPSKVIFSEKTE